MTSRAMANAAKVETDINAIFNTTWSERAGQVVPTTDDVVLKNGAVKLDAVLLYADLAHSTQLVRKTSPTVAAKVVRAYLSSMTQMITKNGGKVRSFDGDRVMGVFIGGSKNSAAAECALHMSWVAAKILRPATEKKFPQLKTKGFTITHCTGVAASEVFVVRGGVRGHNDLVFVGTAPNVAAKLSDLRSGASSYITKEVYNRLSTNAKTSKDGQAMWTPTTKTLAGESWSLYSSTWMRQP